MYTGEARGRLGDLFLGFLVCFVNLFMFMLFNPLAFVGVSETVWKLENAILDHILGKNSIFWQLNLLTLLDQFSKFRQQMQSDILNIFL